MFLKGANVEFLNHSVLRWHGNDLGMLNNYDK